MGTEQQSYAAVTDHTPAFELPAARRAGATSIFRRLAARFIIPGNAKADGLRLAFDIEADGLLDAATTINCIVIADLDSDQVDEYSPDQIPAALDHLARADYLTGHNICGYDLPLLRRLHNWVPMHDCTIVDTLVASRLILPNLSDLDDQAAAMSDPALGKLRGRYSLEAWGARLGIAKTGTDITDWSKWTPQMQERCAGDVAICKALWRFLEPGGYSQDALALEHRVAAICDEITATGVPFDVEAAERLRQQWTTRRAELTAQLAQQFPGTNLNSRKQIGALLEARGWVPEKRTEKTRQPKIDDEVLETIPELYPEFTGLAEHHTLGRRLAQLASSRKAWCRNVTADGRIHGGILHIGTPHSRAAHLEPNLAQVPNQKKGTPFGSECRALFRARDGWAFVTADQAGLQDRGFAHYLAAFDGGAYAATFANGTGGDTHWQSAVALDLVPAGTARDKQNKVHEVVREGAKRFRYAFLYGAGLATAGRIIADIVRAVHQLDGSSNLQQRFFGGAAHPNEAALKQVGKQALNRFEVGTPGLRRLRENLQAHARRHGWLPGLDKRRVPVRALHSALNFIVTSSEAIICKRWLVRVYDELCARFRYGWDGDVVIVLWIHDELVACCRPEIAEQVGEIMVRHAREAAEFYSFKVPLDADFKIGPSWADEQKPKPVPVTEADIAAINVGLAREGIAPITIEATAPPRDNPGNGPVPDPEQQSDSEPMAPPPTERTATSGSAARDDPFAHYASGESRNGRIIATFIYRDAAGRNYQKVHKTDAKQFPQSVWTDKGWRSGAPTIKLPYSLPELIAAKPDAWVFVCEGEKDADSVSALGLVATTNPGGAGKWGQDLDRWFIGKTRVAICEDNDEPGHKHARQVAEHLCGIVPDIRIVSFPELSEHGDVSDWLAQEGHDKDALIARAEAALQHEPLKLPFINFSNWDHEPAPPRAWAVDERIPLYQTTLFSGEGSAGKSMVQLQLSFAHVLMREWLGVVPMPGPALFVDAEDNSDELHRRGDQILKHYGATWADVRGGLHLMSFAGLDAVLAVVDRSGKIEPTPLYKVLLEAASDLKPKMIGIAAAANVFAGNENDRSQVQQFIGLLTRMAIAAGGTVQLITHPSLTGINTDTGLSGNTQWHNSVRARCYLRSVKAKEGEQPDSDLREMVFKKNNYGPISASIILRYQNGLFLPEPGVTSIDQATREATAQEIFLDLLKRFNAENRKVSANKGPNYAPAVFAREDEAKLARLTSKDLDTAMSRLFRNNKIHNEPCGRPSRPNFYIVVH
jgi:RecA-family ATPase/DNA polymerase I-like protein with 3'-5' exonuclease and polymerase domains